jgi:hypothetical protein
MRPGIDMVPSAAVLGHGLRQPLWLWLFRHYSRLLSPEVHARTHRARTAGPNFPDASPGMAPAVRSRQGITIGFHPPCGQAMRKPKLGVGTRVTAIETTAAIAPERGGRRLLG